MDLNIYYDAENTKRYKRPDWFGVVGVSRLYEERELRMIYVTWQEEINPFIVVELLSPSTQSACTERLVLSHVEVSRSEDLGETRREKDEPPTKWQVYEQFLRVPYYIIYDRERDYFRVFQLVGSRYQEIAIADNQLWLEALELGLRLWQGNHKGVERLWLRFYDETENLIPTDAEETVRERQRTDRERQEKEQSQTTLQELRVRVAWL